MDASDIRSDVYGREEGAENGTMDRIHRSHLGGMKWITLAEGGGAKHLNTTMFMREKDPKRYI